MGEPPETKIIQSKAGIHREEGQLRDGVLAKQVQPGRIDWLLLEPPREEPVVTGLPVIGPFTKLLDPFVQLMLRWLKLETCPTMQRLAFGAVLFIPVKNLAAGYRQLSAYLPSVELDPEGSSDFIYRINRPRKSTSEIADLAVNRLSKWDIAVSKLVGFQIGVHSPPEISEGREYFACHLELDVNSAPRAQGLLDKEQLPHLFQELVDLGKEIAREGDIP